jgi:hypothetical protein
MKKILIVFILTFTLLPNIFVNAGVNDYDAKYNWTYQQAGNEGSVLVNQTNITNASVISFNFDFTFSPYFDITTQTTDYTALFNDFTGLTFGLASYTTGNIASTSNWTSYKHTMFVEFDWTESQRRLDISYIRYGYYNGWQTNEIFYQESIFINNVNGGVYDSPPFVSFSINTNTDLTNGSRVRVNVGTYFVDLDSGSFNEWAGNLDTFDSVLGTTNNVFVAISDDTVSGLRADKFVVGNTAELYLGNSYGDIVSFHNNVYNYYFQRGYRLGQVQDLNLGTIPVALTTGLNSIFGINVGGISLGVLMGIPIAFSMFLWFMKVARK